MPARPAGTQFSEVHPGLELAGLQRGPLSPIHLMRFSAAIENWHRIHYDERFAVEHDGLPGLVVSGSWKQHFVAQLLRNWAGPSGWLADVALQFRRPNVAGETLTAWGTVTTCYEQEGFGVVELAVGIRNQVGLESSPGAATVVLPLAADRPVPYPFPGLGARP